MAKCVVCGCTDYDCRGCVEKTGEPCWWFGPDLCSRCAMECRGLSMYQPWAWFVALGIKTIETRFWYTSYRGPILICSGLFYDHSWQQICSRPIEPDCCRSRDLKRGEALCVVNLVDCRPMEKRDERASMIHFEPSAQRFSWVLDEKIIRVAPFAVRGRQRLFKVNESILRKAV
jgi:hypothetical protein